ncbi:phage portal protein [Treponema primitia]|uniref:phage portal protein n=1 Tax=Treponema primitia TaxID=88058 RepID=UPI00397FDDCA
MVDYDGVRTTHFYGQKFPGGLSNSHPSLNIDAAALRQQVRVLSHTSTQAAALISRDVDTVIDSGLMLSPEPQTDILGITPEQGEAWAADVATRFDLWAQSQLSSITGTMNFYTAQRLMQRYLSRDGECFVHHSYSPDPRLLNPLQFALIDPDQIRENGFISTMGLLNLYEIADGIIRNAHGEETAYKVWYKTAGTPIVQMKNIPRIGKSGRVMMTHGMEYTYAGQGRGFSPLAVSIQDLENIVDLAMAQIEKAKNQSNIAFYTESSGDQPASDPFAGIPRIGEVPSGPAAAAFGNTPTPPAGAQNVTPESLEPVYDPIPNTTVRKPGSVGIFNMPSKQTIKPFPNTAPDVQFNAFVDAYFSYIAAANGQSVETVLMKFSNNYSASRATLILTWRIAVQRRYNLACYHLDPLYESWLQEEIAAGRITAPGWSDPRMRAAWLRHRWNGSGAPVIDPLKSINAAKVAAEIGATTLEDIAMEYSGASGKANRSKLAKEYDDLPTPPWTKTTETVTVEEDGEKETEKENKNAD